MSDATRGPVKAAPVPKAAATPRLTPARCGLLQRKCACGGHTEGKCEKCREEEKTLQRKAADHRSAASVVPAIVHDVLNSPGRPLDTSTRAFMEPRFGNDFSGVRVHTNSSAAESARAVGARAYTVGQDIAFDHGQYAPHTESGRHLLAHELAHTIQQGGLQRASSTGELGISSEGDASEREASSAAGSVMQGSRPAIARLPSSPSLHREPWGTCPAGERVSAVPEVVNRMAEDAILKYYEGVAKKKESVISNRKPLEAFFPKPRGKHKRMLEGMYESDVFRSDRPSVISRTEIVPSEEAETLAAPEVEITAEGEPAGESALAAVEGRERAAVAPEYELKRPDIVDLEAREVYDATTIGQADQKVAKIADYVARLEAIRLARDLPGEWKAGTKLKRPPARYLLYQEKGHPAICFGLTDFTLRPGVLAYEPILLPPGAEQTAAVTEPYQIVTKAGKTAMMDANLAPSATDLLNTGPNNMAAARIIRGLVLKTLKRGKTPGQDRITACIVSQGCIEKGEKPPIPITITSGKGEIELKVDSKTRVISLSKNYAGYKFRSKHLSEGTLTNFDIDSEEEGARGVGKLTPSLSILKGKGVEFGVEFSETRYAITAGLEEEKLKQLLKPIPGVTMTKAQLELELYPEFRPSGVLAMELKAGDRRIVDAEVKVTIGPDGGLYAQGTLNAYIPGVDKAEGKVIYQNGQWSAYAELQSTQLNLPYVTGGIVKAGFDERGPYGDGFLDLEIPGGHTARVGLHYRNKLWYFSGKGEFNIKRIGTSVTLIIDYFDGKKLSGKGTVKGFNFKGLTGEITVNYEGRVGASKPRIWGDGTFVIKKGKATGELTVHLLETGKFSGEGGIAYEIKPGLVAAAGISINDKEEVKLTGSLTFPPYILFDRFPKPPKNRIPIFTFPPKKIGVPYLSFGPAGLQARIRAGIFATYGIGPAMIVGGYIKTVIDNPLDENPDIALDVGGKLSLPVSFSVTGFVGGGLVLDILIAEAGGEITVSATATLGGEAGSNFKAHYAKGTFEASADFNLLLKLILTLCFDAYAWASAGVWKFKVTTGKRWHLGDFTYDPGLELGMRMTKPLKYSSATGFDTEGVLSGIEWITPKFDPGNAIASSFGARGGTEAEGKPKPNPCPTIEPED